MTTGSRATLWWPSRPQPPPEDVGLHWTQSVLQLPWSDEHRRRLLLHRKKPGLRPRLFCATNSYVIRKGCVDQSIFTGHVAASNWFQQNPERIRSVPSG